MVKRDWYRKIVVGIAKVKQLFTASGLSKKGENLVAAPDNKNAAGSGAADETVVEEEIADMMKEMTDTYNEELEAIAIENEMTEEEDLSGKITQNKNASRGEKDVDGSTNE